MDPARDEILAGYRRARRDLQVRLEGATPADLRREATAHAGPMNSCFSTWFSVTCSSGFCFPWSTPSAACPNRPGRVFAAALNAGTGPFDQGNYWGSRAAALVCNRRRMGRKLEKTIAALSRRPQRESTRSLAGSMPFPDRRDPCFTPVMTLYDVYAYPIKHFDFHALQLTFGCPDERWLSRAQRLGSVYRSAASR